MGIAHDFARLVFVAHVTDGDIGDIHTVRMVPVVSFDLNRLAVTGPAPPLLVIKVVAHNMISFLDTKVWIFTQANS